MFARRALWISLTLIVVLALAGCGAQPAGQGSVTSQPTTQAAASSPAAAAAGQIQKPTAPAGATAPAGQAAISTPAAGQPKAAATTALTGTVASGVADADPEPNAVDEALAIEAGKTTGTLLEDDEDWFSIHVPAGGIMTVAFAPAAGASTMQIALQDAEGYELWREYDVKAPTIKSFNRVHAGDQDADYAVNVREGTGAYSLEVTIESQDDGGSGADAGDKVTSATPISTSTVITGMVGDLDTDDMYVLDLKAGAVLTLTFSAADDSIGKQAAFLDPDGYELWHEYDITARAKSFSLILSADDAGEYYVQAMGDKGLYRFDVAATLQDDAGSGKDAGDQRSAAVAVVLGKSYTGLIGDHDAYDLYKFEAKGGDILDLALTPADDAETMQAIVLDPDEYELWHEYDILGGSSKSFSHVLDADAGGTYYVAVADGRGAYTLDLVAGAQNDAGSGGDAGDKAASAVDVEPGETYSGQLGGSDADDMYAFEVPDGSVISVSLTPDDTAESLDVALYDADEYELWREYGVGPDETKTYTYVVGGEQGGTYTLWVGSPSAQDSYTFEVQVADQNDGDSGGDAGDTQGTAVAIEPEEEYTGVLGGEDTDDYYSFEPEVGQVIVVTGGAGAEDIIAYVLDGEGGDLWEEYDIVSGDTAEYEITEVAGPTPYHVRIYGSAGTYTVEIRPAE